MSYLPASFLRKSSDIVIVSLNEIDDVFHYDSDQSIILTEDLKHYITDQNKDQLTCHFGNSLMIHVDSPGIDDYLNHRLFEKTSIGRKPKLQHLAIDTGFDMPRFKTCYQNQTDRLYCNDPEFEIKEREYSQDDTKSRHISDLKKQIAKGYQSYFQNFHKNQNENPMNTPKKPPLKSEKFSFIKQKPVLPTVKAVSEVEKTCVFVNYDKKLELEIRERKVEMKKKARQCLVYKIGFEKEIKDSVSTQCSNTEDQLKR